MLRAKKELGGPIHLRLSPLLFLVLFLAPLLEMNGGFLACPAFGQDLNPDKRPVPAVANPSAGLADENRSGSDERLDEWEGKQVLRVEFAGVATSRLDPLPRELAQQPNAPLKAENVRQSLRRLYASGLYDSISAEGSLEGDGVVLIFHGEPRTFIGLVTVNGAKGSNTNSL